jgi:hypothetical protein
MVKRQLTLQFWIEIGLASFSAFLAIVTLVWPDWIEIVFHVDPDESSGSIERLIVGLSFVLAVAFFAVARREWRRAAASSL